jgi:hypothetical protein
MTDRPEQLPQNTLLPHDYVAIDAAAELPRFQTAKPSASWPFIDERRPVRNFTVVCVLLACYAVGFRWNRKILFRCPSYLIAPPEIYCGPAMRTRV